MGIILTGNTTLTGNMKLGIDVVDPFAGQVVFYNNFETNFNNQINGAAPVELAAVTREAGAGYGNSYSARFTGGPNSKLSYSAVDGVGVVNSVPFTIEFWANASYAGGALFYNTVFVTNSTSGFGLSPTRISCFTGGGGSTWVDYTGFTLNQWHHVALTHAANGTINLYLDGVYKTAIAWTTPNIARWKFGASDAGWSAGFNLDQVRITKAVRYTGAFTPPVNY